MMFIMHAYVKWMTTLSTQEKWKYEVCPESIQPRAMKNRNTEEDTRNCTKDNDASVPFKTMAFFFFKKRFYLFIFKRGEGREK